MKVEVVEEEPEKEKSPEKVEIKEKEKSPEKVEIKEKEKSPEKVEIKEKSPDKVEIKEIEPEEPAQPEPKKVEKVPDTGKGGLYCTLKRTILTLYTILTKKTGLKELLKKLFNWLL